MGLTATRLQYVVTAWREHRAPVTLGTLGSLPFIETFMYNVVASQASLPRSLEFWTRSAAMALLLWVLVVVSFLLDGRATHRAYDWLQQRGQRLRHKMARHAWQYLLLFAVAVAAFVFLGRKQLAIALALIRSLAQDLGLLVLIALALSFLAFMLHALGAGRRGLREGMDAWALGIRASIPFYVVLASGYAALLPRGLPGIQAGLHINFWLVLVKDNLLLLLIVHLLYLGLSRLAEARSLTAVFSGLRGFTQFAVTCGIVAVFAIWADFRSLPPPSPYDDWRAWLYRIHIYGRDIGLLLLPIGGVLFWTLTTASSEMATQPLMVEASPPHNLVGVPMSSPPPGDRVNHESFVQICEMARHYGNMRFLFATLWTAVMGALLSVDAGVLKADIPCSSGWPGFAYHFVALLLAVAFIVGEVRMSTLVVKYQELARDKFRPLTLPTIGDHEIWRWIVPIIMVAPLLAAGGYFLIRLFWVP